MLLLLIIRLFDNQEGSRFSFHTPFHTRSIPQTCVCHHQPMFDIKQWWSHLVARSSRAVWCVCVCVCACVCAWTCSCRVPSKQSKSHWYNITVNHLWSALINPSRGYGSETLRKCSRSILRITAERSIPDYWPVAIYIYIYISIYISPWTPLNPWFPCTVNHGFWRQPFVDCQDLSRLRHSGQASGHVCGALAVETMEFIEDRN